MSRHWLNFSAGKTRSVTYGSGGSGDPVIRDVVHATRFSMPTFGESAIALRFIARGTNETNTNVATNLAAWPVAM
jgi:hypothetical protein